MRFSCRKCRFEELEDSGLTPISVRCPSCGSHFRPAAGAWEEIAPPRRVELRVTLEKPAAKATRLRRIDVN